MPCGMELLTAKAATALAFPRWGYHLFQVGKLLLWTPLPSLHRGSHCLRTDHLSFLPLPLLHPGLPSRALTKDGPGVDRNCDPTNPKMALAV